MLSEFLKYLASLALFVGVTAGGVLMIREGDNRGWFVAAMAGTASIYYVVMTITDFYTEAGKARLKEKLGRPRIKNRAPIAQRLRRVLASTWTILAAIVIGVASNLVVEKYQNVMLPSLVVWLCSSVFTLAFYPFQRRQKGGITEFPVWAAYSALMGGISVLLFLLGG
jgi:drug/metabolite transporter (DMT)-like permease